MKTKSSLTCCLIAGFAAILTAAGVAAPNVTATKDDNTAPGVRKNVGNNINYTVNIANTGDATATAVVLTDPTPANTTLIAGSVNATPVALDDTYPFTVIANTSINTATSGFSVITNDFAGYSGDAAVANTALTITAFDAASTGGGTVNMTMSGAGVGQITYTPAPGFTGTDTFTYTISNGVTGGTPASIKATVSIVVGGPIVWFVNPTVAVTGNGTLGSPFKTLAEAATAIGANTNHRIFIYTGGAAQTPITLRNGGWLVGQAVTGTSFDTVMAITYPTDTPLRPAINNGSKPVLAASSGTVIALASGNTVAGLSATNSNGSGIGGSAVGTLMLANCSVTVTNGTALSLTTSGTVTATGTNTLSATNNTALNLASVSIGGSGMTFQSISSSSAATGISITSLGGGSLTVTGDGTGRANGSGGSISNATTQAVQLLTDGGTVSFNSMNFSMNTSATAGVLVDNNAGGTIAANFTGCTFTGVTASISQNKALLQYEAGGSANVTGNVQNCFFNGSRTYGFATVAAGTSVANVTVNQCGFGTDVNTGAAVNQPGTTITNAPAIGMLISNSSGALVDYTVTNNTFWGASGALGAIYAVTISGATTTAGSHLNGSFNFNKIGQTGVTGSGSSGLAAGLGLLPGTTGAFQATVLGNDIRQVNGPGVNFFNSAGAGTSSVATLKFKGNTLAEPDTTGAPLFQRAIVVTPGNSGGGVNNPWKVDIGDTSGTVPADKNNISGAWDAAANIRITNANNGVALTIVGTTAITGATTAQVNAQVLAANTAASATSSLGTAGINVTTTPLPLLFAPGGVERAGAAGVPKTSDTAGGVPETGRTARTLPGAASPLTQTELDTIVAAAFQRWKATGLTADQFATLRGLKFEVANLPGTYLGEAGGTRIRVDDNAGGNGWHVDASAAGDALFGTVVSATRRYTDPVGAPAGLIDLLTVVLHEMGHSLGLEDSYLQQDRESIMYGFLTKGERRLPAANQALGAVPHADGVTHFLAGPLTIGDLPAGKSVVVTFSVTITGTVPSISNQGTVSGGNISNVLTDDPGAGGAADPTVTPIEVPPTVANVAKSVNEDVATAFAAGDFTPGSYSDGNGDALATVRITSLPASGVLKISGSTFTVPQDIAIANIGNLTYTSNLDYNGPDSFGWNGSDGTAFAATGATVNVTVNAVNDKPTFTAVNPPAVHKDAGAQSVVGWATFSAGPANESGQTVLAYNLTNVSNPGLFSAGPSVTTNGTLSYTPSGTSTGTSTFDVTVQDSGGTSPGVDTSDVQTFTITILSTTVTNTNDAGPGSLRAAILASNGATGVQTIDFNISGGGVHVIQPLSALPAITDAVIIDGTTQPGYAGAPLIELDGSLAGAAANGLLILSGNSTVRGLVINRFSRYGIQLRTGGGNVIEGNYIGTNAAGTGAVGNTLDGVLIIRSPSNLIGGTAAAARNVISGNGGNGVHLYGTEATGNLVQGNYIGTDVTGTADLGNTSDGVLVNGAGSNAIGGTTASARNVISGNNRFGVYLNGVGATGNLVQGNFIGTNASGAAAVGNTFSGILVNGAATNTIGGTAAGAGNVISGNNEVGVYLNGGGATGNRVQGNLIGTDVTGALDLGNTLDGVLVNVAPSNTIGGAAAGARNVISGNNRVGVYLNGAGASGNLVRGNFIGTDVTGAVDLGNTLDGVLVNEAPSNTIGGTAAGAGNVISGNNRFGVYLNGAGATNNLVRGNYIGTDVTGASNVGNTLSGVLVANASGNSIGGTAAGAGNTIGFNAQSGVRVTGTATGIAILENSMFTNTGLGIDLDGTGVTANDANDPDAGPNNLQNFPVITSVVLNGANLDITYSVPSIAPNSTFPMRIEFFIADAANQEGKTFLGSDSYTVPGSMLATIPAGSAVLGTRIVATATDNAAVGSTSEFSANTTVASSLFAAAGAAPRLAQPDANVKSSTATGPGTLNAGPNSSPAVPAAGDGVTNATDTTVTRGSVVAGTYDGLAVPVPGAAAPQFGVGLGRLTIGANGYFTGKFTVGGSPTPVVFSGVFAGDGVARFGAAHTPTLDIVRADLSTVTLAMHLDAQFPLTHQVIGTLSHGATVLSTIELNRRLYTSVVAAVSPLMNVPVSILDPATDQGNYTAILQSLDPAAQGLAASAYPQGDGWTLVTVKPTGAVTLSGQLADGQRFTYTNFLSKDNALPFYVPLYSGTGGVSGQIQFRDLPGQSDADGLGLRWFKKPNAADTAYANGWPAGIKVDFLGSKLVLPAITGKTMLGNNPVASPAVKALLALSDGGLTGVLNNQLTLTAGGAVVVRGAPPGGTAAPSLNVSLHASGVCQGSFLSPVTSATTAFKGVVLQKTQRAAGYFLSTPSGSPTPESGAVTITAQP